MSRLWKRVDGLQEWGRNRNLLKSFGFSGLQANLTRVQIDLIPGQSSDIAKALPGIKPEENHAFPFGVGHPQHRLHFLQGKRSPGRLRVTLQGSEHSKEYFETKLDKLFKRLRGRDIPPPKLTVRRMKTRWESCTNDGNILLNADLIQAPSHCVEYVIVHELCHLVHPNHGQGFKRLLVKLLPDWEKRKMKLAEFRG